MKEGYVYLLGDWERDNVCKIGVTRTDLQKRIKKNCRPEIQAKYI